MADCQSLDAWSTDDHRLQPQGRGGSMAEVGEPNVQLVILKVSLLVLSRVCQSAMILEAGVQVDVRLLLQVGSWHAVRKAV